MINHHPDGRFPLLERPINIPGLDIINKSPDGPVFDLCVDTDNLPWGTAYIRAEHVTDMAKALGMKSLQDWEALVEENKRLKEQVDNLPAVVREFKNGLDSLLGDFDSNLSQPINIFVPPVAKEPESVPELDGEPEQTDGQNDSDSGDKRSDKLPESPSDEPFGFLNFPNGT